MSDAARGRSAWLLAIPFLFLVVLIGAVIALVVAIWRGGAAQGEVATLVLAPACPAGRQAVRDRIDAYGLPVMGEDGDRVTVQLPGQPDDRVHMPAVLGAPGRLVLTAAGAALPARVRDAGFQISIHGEPVTLVTVDVALPEGVTATLDGAPVEVASATGEELQLAAQAASSTEAVRLATDRAVQVRLPLPCEVGVRVE